MTLTIKDLPACKELDRAAMTAVRGGLFENSPVAVDQQHTQNPATTTGTDTGTQKDGTKDSGTTTGTGSVGFTLDIFHFGTKTQR